MTNKPSYQTLLPNYLSSAVFTALVAFSATSLVKPAEAAVIGSPIDVDLELSLLLDTSGSVSASEFNLQKQGYVQAFNDPSLWAAVSEGAIGKIAVNFIYWSGGAQQQQAVGWTLINSFAAAQSFANAIAATTRPFGGTTAPGSAINFALPLFGTETGGAQNGFNSTRQVIDVSGDGIQNSGASTALARDNALDKGVDAINGLPIGTVPGLVTWYNNNIKGGTGAFVIPANDFDAFDKAIKEKLIKEIKPPVTSVPEPSSVIGFVFLGGAALTMRRKFTRPTSKSEA